MQDFPELQFTHSSSEPRLAGIGIAVPSPNGARVIEGDPTQGLNVKVTNIPGRLNVNSSGELKVITQGGSGGTNAVDDVAFTVGTDTGVPIMGLFDDAETDSVSEGDVGVLRMSSDRRLYIIDGEIPESSAPVYVNATGSGDTAVLATPGAGLQLNVQRLLITNGGTAVNNVQLQVNGTATNRGPGDLAADGGGAVMEFGMAGWKIAANTGLDVNLGANGDIHVTVEQYYLSSA